MMLYYKSLAFIALSRDNEANNHNNNLSISQASSLTKLPAMGSIFQSSLHLCQRLEVLKWS